jgi:uncharacterized protein (DUF302 family)
MDSKQRVRPYGEGVDEAGIRTIRCQEDVEHVLRRVVVELERCHLEISSVIDHSGDAEEAGLDMPDSKLVVFGHASRRTPLMVSHPTLALDLPMKLLIWKNGDGAVFISYNTAEYLAARYALSDAEEELLEIVADIANAAAASSAG